MSTEQLLNAVKSNSYRKLLAYLSSEKDIDVNIKDDDNWTMLHYASINGNVDIIKILLKNGADPTLVTRDGETPLHIASRKDCLEIVKELLEHAAACRINYINSKTAVHEETPLHVAAKNGFIDVVKSLLSYGAIYNIINKQNKTPLDLSKAYGVSVMLNLIHDCFEKSKNGNIDGMEINTKIKSVSPDVFSALINTRNCQNQSLIQVAMVNNHHKLTAELLEFGEDKNYNHNINEPLAIMDNLPESADNSTISAKVKLEDLKHAANIHLKFSDRYILMLRYLSGGWKAVKEGSYLLGNAKQLIKLYEEYRCGKIEDENLQLVNDTLLNLQFENHHISAGYTPEAYGGTTKCFVSKGQGTVYYSMLHDEGEYGVKKFLGIVEKKIDTPIKKFLKKITQELEKIE